MPSHPQEPDIDPDLARLADGTLPREDAARVTERLGSDPDAARALAEQERVLALLHAAEVPAPERLRRATERMVRGPGATPARPRRRRLAALGAVAAAAAAAALAAIVVPSGSRQPTALDAAAFATKPASSPAPAEGGGGTLARRVQGIPYPYWSRRFGWRSVGSRDDRLASHPVTTVFYADAAGRRIGYSIVAGTALPVPRTATVVEHGVTFAVVRRGATSIVTWQRRGHTCILAAEGVPTRTLLRLGASQTT